MTQHEDSDSIQILPDADKLDRYHRQQLSAMLDGELSPDQARFMLRRLEHDVELAECWERWQICGDVLRGQRNALLPADFASRVSSAIAADLPPAAGHRERAGGRVLRWGGGAALAASVAMAALLVGRQAGPMPEHAPEHAPERAAPALAASAGGPPAATPVPAAGADAARATVTGDAAVSSGPVVAEVRTAQTAPAPPRQRTQMVAAADPSPAPAVASNAGPAPADPVVVPFPSANHGVAALMPAPAQGIGADPFQSLPMTVGSRPWPRAAASGADSAYAVGLGRTMPSATWFLPSLPATQAAADRFGLPAGPVAGMPVQRTDTAIGAGAIPGAQIQAAPGQMQRVDIEPDPR